MMTHDELVKQIMAKDGAKGELERPKREEMPTLDATLEQEMQLNNIADERLQNLEPVAVTLDDL